MAKTAEIAAKLLLDSSDFYGKLGKSKRQLADFTKAGISLVGGLAGAFGLAMGAAEAFNKMVSSSQANTDAWNYVLASTKASVDTFFYAISNGDFSAFTSGLDTIISKAKDAYDALDKLGNVVMSYDFAGQKLNTEFAESLLTLRNKNASPEDKAAAKATAQRLLAEMEENTSQLLKSTQDAVVAGINAKAPNLQKKDINPATIEKALTADVKNWGDDYRASVEKGYKDYTVKVAQARSGAMFSGGTQRTNWGPIYSVDEAKLQKSLSELSEVYGDTVTAYVSLMMYSDDELKKMGSELARAYAAQQALKANQRSYLMAVGELQRGASSGGSGGGDSKSYGEGSIGALEQELTAAKEAVRAAVTQSARQDAEIVVAAIEAKLTELKRTYREVTGQGIAYTKQANPKKDLPKKLDSLDGKALSNETTKDTTVTADDYVNAAKGVDMLSSSFSNLSNAVSSSSSSLASWLGSMAAAAANTLQLIGYLNAESVAHSKVASESAKAAAAKTLESYAGIPFVGIALGLSAVAAIIAAMSSIPAFANGGIVNKPTVGLFGEAGPEAVVPLDKLDEMVGGKGSTVRVTGVIRGRGKDLNCIIGNYNTVRRVK